MLMAQPKLAGRCPESESRLVDLAPMGHLVTDEIRSASGAGIDSGFQDSPIVHSGVPIFGALDRRGEPVE